MNRELRPNRSIDSPDCAVIDKRRYGFSISHRLEGSRIYACACSAMLALIRGDQLLHADADGLRLAACVRRSASRRNTPAFRKVQSLPLTYFWSLSHTHVAIVHRRLTYGESILAMDGIPVMWSSRRRFRASILAMLTVNAKHIVVSKRGSAVDCSFHTLFGNFRSKINPIEIRAFAWWFTATHPQYLKATLRTCPPGQA